MKPRDLTENNWDVNVALLELGDTDIRITASGEHIWFRCCTSIATVDVSVPIKVWHQILEFLDSFTEADLNDGETGFLSKDKNYEVSIFGGIVKFNRKTKTKRIVKKPLSIMFGQWPRSGESWSIQLHLSKFKKIAKWYNTDV